MGRKEKTTVKTRQISLRVSVNALLNIDEITGYIAFIKEQPLNAIKVGDALFAVIDRIHANPLAFKECEEMRTVSKMYRKATCYSWYIIYRVTDAEINILGIIHQSRKSSKIRTLRKVK